MVYFKAMQKNHPNGRFCVRNHRTKNVSEKFRGASALLAPLGSAYEKQLNENRPHENFLRMPWDATMGITSYCCVILKMVILHDAIKTLQNVVFAFFKKRTKTCFFSKETKKFG